MMLQMLYVQQRNKQVLAEFGYNLSPSSPSRPITSLSLMWIMQVACILYTHYMALMLGHEWQHVYIYSLHIIKAISLDATTK
jgi:hypothetical protein